MSHSTEFHTPPTLASNRREQVGWYFYDWANSAFVTTVITVFLGPYLTSIASNAADANGFIHPLGLAIRADSFFPFMVSFSVGAQVLFLPILGAIADYTNLKKRLLGLFAYVGAFATMGLYFLEGERYALGGGLFILANLSFGAAIVFYNAFLPEIAAPDERDRVSSQGWALGYLGGGVLLVVNLLFVQLWAEPLGISTGHAVRISLASAGVWWAIFTVIPLLALRTRHRQRPLPPGSNFVTLGFRQFFSTLREMRSAPQTLLFLLAYLVYNDGIQTVIALSSQFGSQELGLETSSLILLILIVQFVAFAGALVFDYIARGVGTKNAIIISLFIWVGTTFYTYRFLQTERQFFILGGIIAIVLGGSQALSRSLFSQMIPEGREAEYFSLYEISERGTSWLGPLAFALAFQLTNSYRISILSIVLFFALGLILLFAANVQRAIEEAGNELPRRV